MDFIEEAKKLGFSDAAVMKTDKLVVCRNTVFSVKKMPVVIMIKIPHVHRKAGLWKK